MDLKCYKFLEFQRYINPFTIDDEYIGHLRVCNFAGKIMRNRWVYLPKILPVKISSPKVSTLYLFCVRDKYIHLGIGSPRQRTTSSKEMFLWRSKIEINCGPFYGFFLLFLSFQIKLVWVSPTFWRKRWFAEHLLCLLLSGT